MLLLQMNFSAMMVALLVSVLLMAGGATAQCADAMRCIHASECHKYLIGEGVCRSNCNKQC